MEAVIHQAFGDVGDFDAGLALEVGAGQDHLVRATAVLAAVQRRVVILQRFLDVVGIQDRDARGFGQARRRPAS